MRTTAAPSGMDVQAALARLRRVARLLDSRYRVPGTRFRFGLDALVGLVPGLGDVAGAGVALWMLWEARRLGVSGATRAKMLANVLLDLAVGAVPIAGDLFDATFKANLRNVRLLERDLASSRAAAGVPRPRR